MRSTDKNSMAFFQNVYNFETNVKIVFSIPGLIKELSVSLISHQFYDN